MTQPRTARHGDTARRNLKSLLGGLALVAGMWTTGRVGLAVEHQAGIGVIPLWLPTGVALGGLFLLGKRAIPFVWAGSFLVSAGGGRHLWIAELFATGDALSAFLGWWLLTRVPGFDREFRRARDVFSFVLYGAVLPPLLSALIGVLSQAAGGVLLWQTVPGTFLTWWLGDITGVLVSAPLLLRWRTFSWSQLRRDGRLREAAAAYGTMSALILLLWLLPAGRSAILDALWKVFSWPLLLWAALRFGSFGAPSAVFLLTVGNIEEFLRSLQTSHGDPSRVLWDQWGATMALSTAGLVVMALEASRLRSHEEGEKLQLQLAQAQKMESVGRLAGGIAHDFNNLLTVINGHSKLMLARMDANHPLHRQLTQILKAGERAAGLTRQLLAFSRRQVLEARVIDLNAIVEGMQSMLDHMMGDNVEVVLQLHSSALPVFADAHQLEQVIMNLALNARDAMPEGGSLRIGTTLTDRDGSEVAALTVTDTGTGMDEATKRNIFEPFFTTKPTGAGTGLGLSIVQGIVVQTGGSIEVDTTPGRGTTFTVYLPLQPGWQVYEEEPAPAAVANGKESVLVVEDWPDVRQYVADVLRSYGYRVITAADADEAMKLCESGSARFDLVLADVMMTGMSGEDLVARLISMQLARKALLMSGYTGRRKSPATMPGGAYFLQKPFSPEQLAEKVQAILAVP